ncbi:MAG: hypothetical protein IT383_01020 [Deltaproteobacteria bacterium]|nr:hypothetical protein [Deltaproteobacteria bacterium]
MKALWASIVLNAALAGAVAILLSHGGGAAPAKTAAPSTAPAAPCPEPAPPPTAMPVPVPAPEVAPDDAGSSELALCRELVAKLGAELEGHEANNLDKVFEGGEPNEALVARLRAFFPPSTAIVCRDVVCHIDQVDDDETRAAEDRLLRDPWFRALVGAERLGPGPEGRMRRTVKVTSELALDGAALLTSWLMIKGADALQACQLPAETRLRVQLHVDEVGRIGVDEVTGDAMAACVKERLLAAPAQREGVPVRAARLELELPPRG